MFLKLVEMTVFSMLSDVYVFLQGMDHELTEASASCSHICFVDF